jgi:YfiH family protein
MTISLPPAPAAFRWTDEPWGAALRCAPLGAVARHLFTTRQLALRGGSEAEAEWRAALASVGATPDGLMRVRQVHGNTVRVVARGEPADASLRPDGDAVISNVPGLALAVLVADCVPVLLADARSGAAAAVHAGWRGTAAGVAGQAIALMAERFGTRAADLTAAIGPSIGTCCYEVGPELYDAFIAAGHARADVDRWFSTVRLPDGRASLRLDVARANRDQLRAAAVPDTAIHDCRLCTRTHAQVFDSYRAEGNAAGRMAAIVVVPEGE